MAGEISKEESSESAEAGQVSLKRILDGLGQSRNGVREIGEIMIGRKPINEVNPTELIAKIGGPIIDLAEGVNWITRVGIINGATAVWAYSFDAKDIANRFRSRLDDSQELPAVDKVIIDITDETLAREAAKRPGVVENGVFVGSGSLLHDAATAEPVAGYQFGGSIDPAS